MSVSHLEQAFATFKYQLSTLLGVPALPSDIISLDKTPISPWQLDAILRRRALENIQDSAETLQSIIKLVDKIENMPVKEDVRGDILEALSAFEMVLVLRKLFL
jgi:phosphatidylinositol glycan class S